MDGLIELLPVLMFAALALLLFTGVPVAFVLGGVALIFGVIGIAFDVFEFINFFNLVPRIWGGIAERPILTAIPMFIFMGTMLERSGVAKDLLSCLEVLLRRVPGGLAVAVTLMGTIMAATTGIIGASVVMMTLLALRHMLAANYNIPLATGTIAASGTLEILIPPSIMLVLMADLLAVSVGDLFFAAFFPGLILAGLYLLYIVTRCALNPSLAPPLAVHLGPKTWGGVILMVLVSFFPPVLLIVLVLGSILFGYASPTEAAGGGAVGAILLGLVFKPLINIFFGDVSGRDDMDDRVPSADVAGGFFRKLGAEVRAFGGVLKRVVYDAAKVNGMLFMIFLGATAFSYVFRELGGDDIVSGLVEDHSPWFILFAMLVLVFILGFLFDWIEITLIVLPLIAPVLKDLDFAPHVTSEDINNKEVIHWIAILLAVNLQTSFLTPPFGFALFYMKGVAPPEVKIGQIYRGIIPFVILQLIGLAIVVALPNTALWLPSYAEKQRLERLREEREIERKRREGQDRKSDACPGGEQFRTVALCRDGRRVVLIGSARPTKAD